jgi:hypothetical protein
MQNDVIQNMKTPIKNIINPDYISLTTHQLYMCFTSTGMVLSNATGFLFSLEDRIFLITNWHNVSGYDPNTMKTLSEYGGIPDMISIFFRLKKEKGKLKMEKILLYDDVDLTKPNWLVHPVEKEKVDVVAIEISKSDEFVYSAINKADFENDIKLEIGDDCFVIGYPFNEFRYLGLPVWKKASVATEPSVNEDQLPKLLIDSATRPGLSGSPVIFQRSGIHNLVDGIIKDDSIIGTIRGFVGIYSGRIGQGEINAQLGIVWKKHVIEEIITGNQKGDIDFQIRKT